MSYRRALGPAQDLIGVAFDPIATYTISGFAFVGHERMR